MKTITNISLRLALIIIAAFSLTQSIAYAQETPEPSYQSGPYLFNLGLTAGYRYVTTDAYGGNPSDYWNQQRYYEALNYRTGINITSFDLYGERTGNGGFFDELFLTAFGIGDPYTSASLRLRSFGSYDFKVDYRNNRYFMNRDDSIYTGLHKWDLTRQTLNASFAVDATEDIKITAFYNGTGHSGNYTMTVSPFVDGGEEIGGGNGKADATFGTYARGNFYWMNSPKNDWTNEYLLQGTFKVTDNTAFTLGGGYRTYAQDIDFTPLNDTSLTFYTALFVPNAFSGIYGNFPNSPKTISAANNNPLLSYTWNDNRESKTPIAFFEAVSRPIDGLSVTANLRWENTSTEGSTIKGNLLGIMPTAPTTLGGPKTAGQRTIADTTVASNDNKFKYLLGSLTVSGRVNDEITLTGLYRYTNTDLTSSGTLDANVGTNDTVTKSIFHQLYAAQFKTEITNTVSQNYLQGFINFTPMNMLNIRAGIQYTSRDPLYNRLDDDVADSVINANLSRQQKGFTPFANFWYKPITELKISGSFSHSDIKSYIHGTTTQVDNPIRIIPEVTNKYSAGVEVVPVKDLHVSLAVKGMNGSTDLLSMAAIVETYNPKLQSKMLSFSGTLGYKITRNSSVLVSAESRKNDFQIPVSYTRGQLDPTPIYGDSLTIDDEQHTQDLSLDASVMFGEVQNLHVMVGYSMIRSTGGSIVTIDVKPGLAPDLVRMGGPYRWSLLHANAAYDITSKVGVMADYQLAMQKEDGDYPYTNVMNNYKASLIRGSLYIRL
jgi:hypothetical protein